VSTWAVFGSLVAAALAVAAATGFLVVRVLDAWRALRRLRRHLGTELARLADLGEATVEKAAAASETEHLHAELAGLRLTLARFAVLRASVEEVRDAFGRVTAVYPRK
jgi:hypothetical protein